MYTSIPDVNVYRDYAITTEMWYMGLCIYLEYVLPRIQDISVSYNGGVCDDIDAVRKKAGNMYLR